MTVTQDAIGFGPCGGEGNGTGKEIHRLPLVLGFCTHLGR